MNKQAVKCSNCECYFCGKEKETVGKYFSRPACEKCWSIIRAFQVAEKMEKLGVRRWSKKWMVS